MWQKVSPLSLCPYGGWRVGEVDCKCRILSRSSKHQPGTLSISLALALTSWVTRAGYSVFVRLSFLLYKMGEEVLSLTELELNNRANTQVLHRH